MTLGSFDCAASVRPAAVLSAYAEPRCARPMSATSSSRESGAVAGSIASPVDMGPGFPSCSSRSTRKVRASASAQGYGAVAIRSVALALPVAVEEWCSSPNATPVSDSERFQSSLATASSSARLGNFTFFGGPASSNQ